MKSVCRFLVIWLTTAMLFVQMIGPANLFGCCCSNDASDENHLQNKTNCCNIKLPSKTLASGQGDCCFKRVTSSAATKKQNLKTVSDERLVSCLHNNQYNNSKCHCAKNNLFAAIPTEPTLTQRVQFASVFLALAGASSPLNQEDYCHPFSCEDSSYLMSFQRFAQIQLCVSLL
ncbi:hypothetical protein [Gimesia aquarii]|uniref:Uncharacterized protein n=1 Tax=Gimesia aquarii TaxID=2527964 RepID=A0A517VTU2_9PLAN|nr:hypothetical protein [Gimesia aquarii]QDT96428.1 hypothetical protein V144x_18840 [Gimesia aquarii]